MPSTSGSQCSVRHIDFQKFMQKETDAVVNAYCRKHKYDQHDIETKRMLVRENLILLEDTTRIIACGGMPMPLTKRRNAIRKKEGMCTRILDRHPALHVFKDSEIFTKPENRA